MSWIVGWRTSATNAMYFFGSTERVRERRSDQQWTVNRESATRYELEDAVAALLLLSDPDSIDFDETLSLEEVPSSSCPSTE